MSWSLNAGTYVIIDAHAVDKSIRNEIFNDDQLILNISDHISESVDSFEIDNNVFTMTGELGEYYLGFFNFNDISEDISNHGYILKLEDHALVERIPNEHSIQIGSIKIQFRTHENMEKITDQFSEY